MNGGTRLRLARQARGFSQQQLAGMAGVSRQAVSAVESGQSDPSLRAALALAEALGMSVEELFGGEGAAPVVSARLLGGPAEGGEAGEAGQAGEAGRAGGRVTLAPVGASFVALPLAGPAVSRAGFLPAGGLLTGGPAGAATARAATAGAARTVAVQPIGPPRPTLVVAGCDPALPLLAEPLSLLDPPVAFSWWPCSSGAALRLAAAGLVHAAGVHLRDRDGNYNTAAAAELLPGGAEVFGFGGWREGLVLHPAVADRVDGVADVARHGLRLVNREPGAEARRVLDNELARSGISRSQVTGYETRAAGHLQVAEAIAAGLAEAGVACEPAARAYGLAFVPLTVERFDLIIPAAVATSREALALLKVLSSRWLIDQLASLPGYDPASCGLHVSTLPSAEGA